MAMSYSRPDPSSPPAVSTATFATSRKGFDQVEVRDFLRMVAAELARLQEREKFLELELRTAQRGTNSVVALDEALFLARDDDERLPAVGHRDVAVERGRAVEVAVARSQALEHHPQRRPVCGRDAAERGRQIGRAHV